MRIFQVDAFADRSFRGNPAGVCLLDEARPDEWCQAVAAEMNLPETAFVARGEDRFPLRWFTPTVEVALCGHATLASAHVLWEAGEVEAGDHIVFDTLSGPLDARRIDDVIMLDFPADPPFGGAPGTATEGPRAAPTSRRADDDAEPGGGGGDGPLLDLPAVVDALGTEAVWWGRSRLFGVVEVASEDAVRGLAPDLRAVGRASAVGVVVTARADPGQAYDVVSRVFAPSLGIDEDPVTGSAHCVIGPLWSGRLGRAELVGYQASARGGFVRIRCRGDRVELGGGAVTFLRGTID